MEAEAQRKVRTRQGHLIDPSKTWPHLCFQHCSLPELDVHTSLGMPFYAWLFLYIWNQTAHLASNSCQPSTSDANSSFNASSDLFKVEGLSHLHKWLRSVIWALSMFDRLVPKQMVQTAKWHWVKQCSESIRTHFFLLRCMTLKPIPNLEKFIMCMWNLLPLVGILLQNFLSSKKKFDLLWFIML